MIAVLCCTYRCRMYIAFVVINLMLHVMLSDVVLPYEDCDVFDYRLMCFDG